MIGQRCRITRCFDCSDIIIRHFDYIISLSNDTNVMIEGSFMQSSAPHFY